MLIIEEDIAINLDKVRRFYVHGSRENYGIFFEFDDDKKEIIGNHSTLEEIERIFNEIIVNYNSGKKVYVIE